MTRWLTLFVAPVAFGLAVLAGHLTGFSANNYRLEKAIQDEIAQLCKEQQN
jgi:hypothetical protein